MNWILLCSRCEKYELRHVVGRVELYMTQTTDVEIGTQIQILCLSLLNRIGAELGVSSDFSSTWLLFYL